MRTAARVDSNQPGIVRILRSLGAHVLVMSQLKNAFDLLVGYRGVLYIVEIKDGDKPLSKQMLTEGELRTKEAFNRVGVSYNIITTVDEAIKLIS